MQLRHPRLGKHSLALPPQETRHRHPRVRRKQQAHPARVKVGYGRRRG